MTTTDTIPTIEREIKYSRQDRDYACYVNGQYIGSRANYSDAETLCDQVAYDLIADGQCATATELDGGASVEEIAADTCPDCDDTGLIPNGSGTGDQCGGWADTCACRDAGARPNLADALLAEADAVLAQMSRHPGPDCFCPDCLRAIIDPPAGPDSDPIPPWPIAPYCGACGGQHAIQRCPALWTALRAPEAVAL